MKRIIAAAIGIAVMLVVSSCGKETAPAGTSTASGKTVEQKTTASGAPVAPTKPPSDAAPETDADRQMRAAFESQTTTPPVIDFAVRPALSFISDVTPVKFTYSEKASRMISEKDLKISLLRQDVPLKDSLREELGKIGLACRIRNGAVEIIAQDE
jgi:hypothetical protein